MSLPWIVLLTIRPNGTAAFAAVEVFSCVYAALDPAQQKAAEQVFGRDHTDGAWVFFYLGQLYCDQGRPAEAVPLRLFPAASAEQEAQAIDLQVRQWLLADIESIGIVTPFTEQADALESAIIDRFDYRQIRDLRLRVRGSASR